MASRKPAAPRKTLSLARKPQTEGRGSEGAAPSRKRSGARARQIAQQEIAREKTLRLRALAPPSGSHSGPPGTGSPDTGAADAHAPAAGRPGTGFPDAGMPGSATPGAAPPVPAQASRRRREPRPAETFAVFAPCPQGLEEALAAELDALGFDDVRAGRAGAGFRADWSGIMRANLYSRLATRILVQVAHAPVASEQDVLELARSVPWERWFGPRQTLRVDTSAIGSPMKSLQYCNLRAKDGICDRLREREGERPDIDTVRPDARVHLFLSRDAATLYLDTSGESLFKRGWRLDKGAAPLRENLAAGMLALAGWDPAAPLLDPFCGSGTILIEAAWIALGVPAGIARPFGFERLRGHDARRWKDLREDARSRILPRLDAPFLGMDCDPAAIDAARQNAERAWLTEDAIRFETGDARQARPTAENGWIVTNPPYGERLDPAAEALWPEWATALKRHFGGWRVAVISSDRDFPRHLRLKPARKTPLYNGALECRLFEFEMVSAGYR